MNINEKNQLRAIPSSHNADDPLALIDCGELSLLLSSKDIVTLMSAQKIIAPSVTQACGAIDFEQLQIPVFSLNKALQLTDKLSANQLTLVVLQYQTRIFAVSCCALEKIEISGFQFFPVPVSMSSRKQPFTHFAVLNNRAAGLTSAANLSRLLDIRGVVFSTISANVDKRVQGAS